MSRYGVLVYGGGNCEIAASLQHELIRLGEVEEANIFARGYLFGNSCLAMYKRFHNLKDEIDTIKTGGVYEYFQSGYEKVETMELKMRPACSQEELQSFLYTGLDRIKNEEIILILIGQSNEKGLFIDFLEEEPTYMPYRQMLDIIGEIGREKQRRIKLILDIPSWHPMILPYLISRSNRIDIAYIFERPKSLELLPITDFISALEKKHKSKSILTGYTIDTHSLWWNICKREWEVYLAFPTRKKWTDFYEVYKKLVHYSGKKHYYYKIVNKQSEKGVADFRLSKEELREYFREYCMESLEHEEIKSWLKEMKTCTDYYKL